MFVRTGERSDDRVLLRDLGADVIEVRAVLGQAAADDEIAAFARATGR